MSPPRPSSSSSSSPSRSSHRLLFFSDFVNGNEKGALDSYAPFTGAARTLQEADVVMRSSLSSSPPSSRCRRITGKPVFFSDFVNGVDQERGERDKDNVPFTGVGRRLLDDEDMDVDVASPSSLPSGSCHHQPTQNIVFFSEFLGDQQEKAAAQKLIPFTGIARRMNDVTAAGRGTKRGRASSGETEEEARHSREVYIIFSVISWLEYFLGFSVTW